MKLNRALVLSFCIAACTAYAQKQEVRLTADNIDKVIQNMTLAEKAQLVVGGDCIVRDGKKAGKQAYASIGAIGMTRAIPRLGIPGTLLVDGPAGVRLPTTRPGDSRTYYATAFPVATLTASSWDKDNARRIGEAMGQEALDYGGDILLTPAINIQRNPLNGRSFEYFSEDPMLTAAMAIEQIKGVQSKGIGTSLKHFAANNQETFRRDNNSIVSQRALREIYLKAFELTVRSVQPWTIMASYNKLNGTWTQSKRALLHDYLRGELGFKGLVMTDWTGEERCVADNLNADDNLMMPGLDVYPEQIVDAVRSGLVKIQTLDNAVRLMLEYIVRTPSFKGSPKDVATDLKSHSELSRLTAQDGIILVKNDGVVLPLAAGSEVALFGYGSYGGYIPTGMGSGSVNTTDIVNLAKGLSSVGYRLNSELQDLYADAQGEVAISMGYAERRAKESDVAIVTIRRNSSENEDRHNEKGDWLLTDAERASLEHVAAAYHALGKKVVVVLNIVAPMEVASWEHLADAIILPWTPGTSGGLAIANVISGKVNPSGHLPMTFARAYDDIPSSRNFPSNYHGEAFDPDVSTLGYTRYSEGIWVGYRYFNTRHVPVVWPFGYGLSYTTFSFANPRVRLRGDCLEAEVVVTNTGSRAGRQVAQLYIAAPAEGSRQVMEKPRRELKDFAKTRLLQPGESQRLTFNVPLDELASFDEKQNSWITDMGTYQAEFGDNVEHILCSRPFLVKKRTVRHCPTVL